MHHHPYSRAVEERAYVNRAVDDAHAWLVEHCQHIEDDHGVVIPVDWYHLKRMRSVKEKYGDPTNKHLWPPSEIERSMMTQYDILMSLYANRPIEGEQERNTLIASWGMIVAILAPWLLLAIGYGIWRWLN